MALNDKYTPGKRVRWQASDLNAILDAAQQAREQDFEIEDKPDGGGYACTIIRVRNDSGADRKRFDVLGLGAPLVLPSADLAEFKRAPTFVGSTPIAGTHENKFCVLVDNIPQGEIGAALVYAIPAQLIGADVGTAEIANSSTVLQAKAGGSARVLWAEPGAGQRWALVRIGGGAATMGTCSVLVEYDDYLLCANFTFTSGTPQPFNPDLGTIEVSSATWAANVVTFNTAVAHGLSVGSKFMVIESSPAAYDGTYMAVTASGSTVTAALNSNPGTWVCGSDLIDLSKTLYVAKPYQLQRSPWDLQVVKMPDGTYEGYKYPGAAGDQHGSRQMSVVVPFMVNCDFVVENGNLLTTSQQMPLTEIIHKPYMTGDILAISSGPTGILDPNGIAIAWTDVNEGGRHWLHPPDRVFPARLTAIQFRSVPDFNRYAWTGQIDSATPNALTFSNGPESGDFNTMYAVNLIYSNPGAVKQGPVIPVSASQGTPVMLRHVFGQPFATIEPGLPYIEAIRRTGNVDTDGDEISNIVIVDQSVSPPVVRDGEETRDYNFNSL